MEKNVMDLVGPGIGNYEEVEKVLPRDYFSLLTPKETQIALKAVKDYIEDNLAKELNLIMVAVPLIVDKDSGVNDYLDRDGSRSPVEFFINNDHGANPVTAQVVQARRSHSLPQPPSYHRTYYVIFEFPVHMTFLSFTY